MSSTRLSPLSTAIHLWTRRVSTVADVGTLHVAQQATHVDVRRVPFFRGTAGGRAMNHIAGLVPAPSPACGGA